MFARLCQHNIAVDVKRRHSWSSDSDIHPPDHLSTSDVDEPADVWDIPDLVGPCRDLDDANLSVSDDDDDDADDADDVEADMGQRPSFLLARPRPKISLTWVLRGEAHQSPPPTNTNIINNIEKPTKFINDAKCHKVSNDGGRRSVSCSRPKRTLSEPSLIVVANSDKSGRNSRSSREKTRHRHRRHRSEKHRRQSRFGYEITDVNAFLTKASLDKPANIPVVLASPCMLYLTRLGGYQEEIALPLGMVVNAVFKNQIWLYVQTPHGEEGYVSYAACLPLGILPPPQRSHSTSKPPPCWENHTDIFPLPQGNRTDTEKLRDGTRSECGGRSANHRARYERDAVSACGERSVDRLYLRAAASVKSKGIKRHTLLVIRSDYENKGRNTLTVAKGDVVALVSNHLKDWFWVRARDGSEGFIPAVVAGHGFL